MTTYLPPLPTTAADLYAAIEAFELKRERLRNEGRLSPEATRAIAYNLRELRSAYAVAVMKETSK